MPEAKNDKSEPKTVKAEFKYFDYQVAGVWDVQYIQQENGESRVRYVRFIPGVNQISESDWDKIKNNPAVQNALDHETLVEVKALSTMSEIRSKKTVEATYSEAALNGLAEGEKRKSVKAAIEAQRKKIKAPIEVKANDDDEDGE